MEALLNYIHWCPDVEMVRIGGLALRWYSMCWVAGLFTGYVIVKKLYSIYKIDNKLFEPLFFYCFFGILIGARLGHCLFYEPDYFLASGKNITEMLLPIRFLPDGSWKFIGYEGLASHGGVIGMFVSMWIYTKRTKVPYMFVMDTMAMTAPFTAMFIRLGNLMNSEIIGKVTDVPWAFIFERVDTLPRHPGQLYEAISYLIIGIVEFILFRQAKFKKSLGTGFFFGFCIACCFIMRILIEFVKEVQEDFEEGMSLDMGQLLSIPLVIIGFYLMYRGFRKFSTETVEK